MLWATINLLSCETLKSLKVFLKKNVINQEVNFKTTVRIWDFPSSLKINEALKKMKPVRYPWDGDEEQGFMKLSGGQEYFGIQKFKRRFIIFI